MKTVEEINAAIAAEGIDTNFISDGYHTFGELYDHRVELFIALCRKLVEIAASGNEDTPVWRSWRHSDGSEIEGWFILGIGVEPGEQITYHLPEERWVDTAFAETRNKAPEYDGHSSEEVLGRLLRL